MKISEDECGLMSEGWLWGIKVRNVLFGCKRYVEVFLVFFVIVESDLGKNWMVLC